MLTEKQIEKRLNLKKKGLGLLTSTDEIALVLLLIKNGIPITDELIEKVDDELNIQIPKLKKVVDDTDVEGDPYDNELIDLVVLMLAKRDNDKRASKVENMYSNFKNSLEEIYMMFQNESSQILNENINKVEKIKNLYETSDLSVEGVK